MPRHVMTVGELKKALKDIQDDVPVAIYTGLSGYRGAREVNTGVMVINNVPRAHFCIEGD